MNSELRVLVASPDDVKEEREIALRVLMRLRSDPAIAAKMDVRPVLWEHQPQHAGETFQKQISHPAEAHIVVVIFWSKFGSPLPNVPEFRGPDGHTRTGTEFEFEEAIQSWQKTGAPIVLVYRSKRQISFHPGPEGEAIKDQFEALESFWNRRIRKENRAHKWFESAKEFEEALEVDLRASILERSKRLDQFAAARAELHARAVAWRERNYPSDLLLRSGQLLRDAAEIQKAFRNQLDANTNAYISDSLNRQSRKSLVLASVVCAFALVALCLVAFFWRESEANYDVAKKATKAMEDALKSETDARKTAEIAKDNAEKVTVQMKLARDEAKTALKKVTEKHAVSNALLDQLAKPEMMTALQQRLLQTSENERETVHSVLLDHLETTEVNYVQKLQSASKETVQRDQSAWIILSAYNDVKASAPLEQLQSLREKNPKEFQPVQHLPLINQAQSALDRQLQIDRVLNEKIGDNQLYVHIVYDLGRLARLQAITAEKKKNDATLNDIKKTVKSALSDYPTDLTLRNGLFDSLGRLMKSLDNYGDDSAAYTVGVSRIEVGASFIEQFPRAKWPPSLETRDKIFRELAFDYVNVPWSGLLLGHFKETCDLSEDGLKLYQKYRDAQPQKASASGSSFQEAYVEMATTYAAALYLRREFDTGRNIYVDHLQIPGFTESAMRDIKNLRETKSAKVRKAFMDDQIRAAFDDVDKLLKDKMR